MAALLIAPFDALAQSRFDARHAALRPPRPCLEEAARRLKPDEQITLHLRDGTRLQGRYTTQGGGTSHLIVLAPDSTNVATYALDEIESIRFRKPRRPSFSAMFGGLAIGTAVGGLTGYLATRGECSSSSGGSLSDLGCGLAPLYGAVFGGAAGFLVGTIVPPIFPGTATLRCTSP